MQSEKALASLRLVILSNEVSVQRLFPLNYIIYLKNNISLNDVSGAFK